MSTTPRIPAEYAQGFFMQMEPDPDNPATQIAIPVELSRLAGIPVATKSSFQLDPVLHELIRIYNAKVQDCQYCQNARQAVAVQAGLEEDMVQALSNFESSDLPEPIKAALRLTAAVSTNPGLISDELWEDAARHYSGEGTRRHRVVVDAHHRKQGHDHARAGPGQGEQFPAFLPHGGRLRRVRRTRGSRQGAQGTRPVRGSALRRAPPAGHPAPSLDQRPGLSRAG